MQHPLSSVAAKRLQRRGLSEDNRIRFNKPGLPNRYQVAIVNPEIMTATALLKKN
jgi:hypothetical protein